MKTGFDDVVRRLQTYEGQQLVNALAGDLEPIVPRTGLMEGNVDPSERSKDQFLGTVVEEMALTFNTPSNFRSRLPATIANAFARATDDKGQLTPMAVVRTLGPAGLQFLKKLQAIEDTRTPQLADRGAFENMGARAASKALVSSELQPPKMAVLDKLQKQIAKPDELKGFKFFGLQHLFMSSATLFGALESTGIKPQDMRLQGKIYSTNYRTAAYLEDRGANVAGSSRRLVKDDFEGEMAESVEWELRQLIDTLPHPPEKSPKPEILIIDDGGKAIQILHKKFPQHAGYFVAVEQTRRGARAVQEIEDLKCPVVNVAESWAKIEWESPMIGHSVMLEVTRKLDELEKGGVDTGKEATILGYGAVGQAVAKALTERGFDVHIYDPDPKRRAQATAEGMYPHAKMKDALPHGQTLVSCVGKRTLTPEHHDLLPDGAIMVNAASSDDELGPEDLTPFRSRQAVKDSTGDMWALFQGKPINTGQAHATAHSDSVIRKTNGKELLLVNNGYVINMTGERDPIPARYIQLTRSLLFLGALAAKRADKPGLIDVPIEWQKELVTSVQKELAETGESLLAPDWEKRGDDYERPVIAAPPEIVYALGLTPEATDPNTTYGYTLGPVNPGSKEERINSEVGSGDGNLTVAEAAIHKAMEDVNEFFGGFHINARVNLGDMEADAHLPGQTATSDDDKTSFEQLYVGYLLGFVNFWASRGHGDPRPEQIAKQMSRIMKGSGVNPRSQVARMQRSDDLQTRQVGQKIYRRMRLNEPSPEPPTPQAALQSAQASHR